jgi:uncharacterized protein (TIGR02266 family)
MTMSHDPVRPLDEDEDDDPPTAKLGIVPNGAEVVVVDRVRGERDERPRRLDVSLMVSVDSESNFYVGFTENLSDGGVFVATHAPRPIGCSVDLLVALPDQAPIRAKGTVAWLREYAETIDAAPGMGIRFDQISPEDVKRILEFGRARPPMFFDGEIVVAEEVATP